MLKSIAVCVVAAGVLLLNAIPSAADDASDPLLDKLGADINPAEVPQGYKFFLAQPTAQGDEDIHQKVEARVQLMFTREGLIVKKSEFGNEGWEGFTYFVFEKPETAAQFKKDESDAWGEFKVWAGDDSEKAAEQLNPQAWRGSMTINVKSPTTGANLEERCVAADFIVGCLSVEPQSRVAIHLVMQEPQLRQAATDDERVRLVTARVQKEATGLLQAAEAHLSDSLKAAMQ